MKIALLHPGNMGVTIGAALLSGNNDVYWVQRGRSTVTRMRAEDAGFKPLDGMDGLPSMDAVISVCPPHGAESLAGDVKATGFSGIFVDANAVSPVTAAGIGDIIGEKFVDGGIIGPPAHHAGTTRLYLSGPDAGLVEKWFKGSILDAVAIEGGPGSASALKMCYAAYTKGSSALILAVRALAEIHGVTGNLLAEWELSQKGLKERSEFTAMGTANKAWRFVGEMGEIASTFEAAGLPGGFHRGAGEIYELMADLKDAGKPGLDDVLDKLLRRDRKS